MKFDHRKLRGKIREFGTIENLANKLGITKSTLCNKLNNKGGSFTAEEIVLICRALEINLRDAYIYFFTELSSESETND